MFIVGKLKDGYQVQHSIRSLQCLQEKRSNKEALDNSECQDDEILEKRDATDVVLRSIPDGVQIDEDVLSAINSVNCSVSNDENLKELEA